MKREPLIASEPETDSIEFSARSTSFLRPEYPLWVCERRERRWEGEGKEKRKKIDFSPSGDKLEPGVHQDLCCGIVTQHQYSRQKYRHRYILFVYTLERYSRYIGIRNMGL